MKSTFARAWYRHQIKMAYLCGIWEDSRSSGALNVKREDTHWRHTQPFALGGMGDEIGKEDVCLQLRQPSF